MNGLKGLLTVPGNGILNAALEKVGVVLHAEGITIGRPVRLKHGLHFPLLDLRGPSAVIHVQGGLVLIGDGVLLHAAAKEGLHVIVLVVLGRDLLA